MGNANAWEDVLAALEHDLHELEAVVADLDRPPYIPTFTPPPDLGPIPPELAARAIGIAAAYDAAVANAEAQRARIAAELARTAHSRPAAPPRGASRIDFAG